MGRGACKILCFVIGNVCNCMFEKISQNFGLLLVFLPGFHGPMFSPLKGFEDLDLLPFCLSKQPFSVPQVPEVVQTKKS